MFFLLLAINLNVNLKDNNGNYPLHIAARQKNKITIQCLLNAGATQDVTNKEEQTPLHLFVSTHDDSSITEFLIGKNIDKVDKNLRSALHLAAKQGFHLNVKTLLEHGANLVLRDEFGNIPLHYGIHCGSYKCRNVFMNHMELTINFIEVQKIRFQLAIKEMNKAAAKDLLPFIDAINFFDKDGQTPLHLAAENDDFEIIRILMENHANPNLKNRIGLAPIHILAMHGRIQALELLLNFENVDVEVKNNLGETPLVLAERYRQIACMNILRNHISAQKLKIGKPNEIKINFLQAIKEMDVVTTKGLSPFIDHINFFGTDGQTPLHLAAENDDIGTIKCLMECKANPNLKNQKGETAIHILAMHGRVEALQLLLKYNITDALVKDNCQQTPLDLAIKYGQTPCVTLLKDYNKHKNSRRPNPNNS